MMPQILLNYLANCTFVLTHDICLILLFFIASFNVPMSVHKCFSVMHLFEAKTLQSNLVYKLISSIMLQYIMLNLFHLT